MSLISFIKEAGQKLFGHKEVEQTAAKADSGDAAAKAKVEELNGKAGDAIVAYIRAQNLEAESLAVAFDGATGVVSVFGTAPDQATREKIVLCCGNVAGVVQVDDGMSVDSSEPEAVYYTVVSGDNLSKISKANYGDPNKYMIIFEANKPMLAHPDKIYPGQVLRIPPL
jgi:nucleoid-associated protein YgaU